MASSEKPSVRLAYDEASSPWLKSDALSLIRLQSIVLRGRQHTTECNAVSR